jgi:hypothetical protein
MDACVGIIIIIYPTATTLEELKREEEEKGRRHSTDGRNGRGFGHGGIVC